MADEAGIGSVSLASLAERLGVKPPALYKHIGSIGDLQHRIAALAMSELGEALRDALQGKAGSQALAAMFDAMRQYVTEHPGRYSATVGAEFQGQDDPLLAASVRVIRSIGAVLSGYGIAPDETDYAIRALRCVIHGFAMVQAASASQEGKDLDESFDWMIRFVDAGLRGTGDVRQDHEHPSPDAGDSVG
jgi:AcrR family transcriptional regulator